MLDAGSIDFQPPWIPTFRALGINIAMMSDFHGDGHGQDAGALRLGEQKAYFDACARHSDRDFLIIPGEEPNAHFGGHYTTLFSRPVYWTRVRLPGQPLVENHHEYGKVYHVGSPADELRMLEAENGLVQTALLLVALATVMLLTFLAFLIAGTIERSLGPTGMNVVSRILGILLAAVSAEMILAGLKQSGIFH